jgi:hypothetical protein
MIYQFTNRPQTSRQRAHVEEQRLRGVSAAFARLEKALKNMTRPTGGPSAPDRLAYLQAKFDRRVSDPACRSRAHRGMAARVMVGDEKPDPDRPIEEWTDNDRFINVSSSRAHAREQKGPSARPAAKAWRLRGPLARTTSVLSTRSMTARACAFAKALLTAAILARAASRIAIRPEEGALDDRFSAQASNIARQFLMGLVGHPLRSSIRLEQISAASTLADSARSAQLSKTNCFGQCRPHRGVIWRDHRIVGGKLPFRAILIRRQAMRP